MMARQMKDSGVKWIGEIPADWEICKVKDYFSVKNGSTPSSNVSEYWAGDISWLTPSDYKTKDVYINSSSRSITQKGYDSCGTTMVPINSIVVSNRAPIGSVGITQIPLCTNQGCKSLVKRNEINSKFVYYFLAISNSELNILGRGTTFVELSSYDLGMFSFPLPSVNEQQKIAGFLDEKVGEIDFVIAKTKATIEDYKKYKQAIITDAVTKGLNQDVKMINSEIEWIDMIPNCWKEKKLKQCTYIRARLGWKGLKADEYVESGYVFLSAFNIINDKLDFGETNYINQFRYDESPEIKLNVGDVLLVKDGAGIGKCAYVDYLPKEATVNGSIALITVDKLLLGKYLYYFLLSKLMQKYVDRIKGGMGVPHLFQRDIKEIKIPIPTLVEQKEIIAYLDEKCSEIDKLIAKKEELLVNLESYKKSLIYEYVTGKKEIK